MLNQVPLERHSEYLMNCSYVLFVYIQVGFAMVTNKPKTAVACIATGLVWLVGGGVLFG